MRKSKNGCTDQICVELNRDLDRGCALPKISVGQMTSSARFPPIRLNQRPQLLCTLLPASIFRRHSSRADWSPDVWRRGAKIGAAVIVSSAGSRSTP